jgi:hypothetical protein
MNVFRVEASVFLNLVRKQAKQFWTSLYLRKGIYRREPIDWIKFLKLLRLLCNKTSENFVTQGPVCSKNPQPLLLDFTFLIFSFPETSEVIYFSVPSHFCFSLLLIGCVHYISYSFCSLSSWLSLWSLSWYCVWGLRTQSAYVCWLFDRQHVITLSSSLFRSCDLQLLCLSAATQSRWLDDTAMCTLRL